MEARKSRILENGELGRIFRPIRVTESWRKVQNEEFYYKIIIIIMLMIIIIIIMFSKHNWDDYSCCMYGRN
jgi:hypothetical protein